jgi:hypothetical protein
MEDRSNKVPNAQHKFGEDYGLGALHDGVKTYVTLLYDATAGNRTQD